ncbi:MAG: hypothetical protein JKY61_05360 [Planctomycetes bacterium]|nr:hypothetical protein [Planctomycetota bacterium]
MREIPGSQDLTTTVNFPQVPTDPEVLQEGVTTRPNYSVPMDASIVISVPVEEQLREGRSKEAAVASAGADEGISSFRTTGYFNRAEQQIVRSLIGKGFNVVDRSKFEAKLRDQREADNQNYYRRHSEAKSAAIQAATEKKESGMLTVDQWAAEMGRIEKEFVSRASNSGRKPGQSKELVDNSELIRAAQSGETRADFILQVNTFTTESMADERLYLTSFKEIDAVCQANPGLRTALDRSGYGTITQPGFFGYLNAMLIDVQSGAIVWVGEHRVITANVLKTGYTVKLPVSKSVSNGSAINKGIKDYNKDLRALANQAQRLKLAIESGQYQPAPGEVLTPASKVNVKVAEYYQMVAALNEMLGSDGPEALRQEFSYEFIVEPIELRPLLPTEETLMSVEERYRAARTTSERTAIRREHDSYANFLSTHYTALAKLAAKELISTIPAK